MSIIRTYLPTYSFWPIQSLLGQSNPFECTISVIVQCEGGHNENEGEAANVKKKV